MVQKADKANTVVMLGKCSYISAIEEVLDDNSKFSKLDIPAGKEINHTINPEKIITSEHKLYQKTRRLRPVGSKNYFKSILCTAFYSHLHSHLQVR